MLPWINFTAIVFIMLALDLGVFNREAHEVSVKEALGWSAVWVAVSLLFNLGVWYWNGPEVALQFLTGYLIEKALSVDNIFVFVLLFSYFKVKAIYQHKVLFWGIIGAFIMRAVLIATGSALIRHFDWIFYVFGAFLVITGIKMAFSKEEHVDPEKNIMVRLARRFIPVTPEYREGKFFVIEHGKRYATPLFIVILAVEATDLVFALDSIPAIFAITPDPFIVYTSNVFAILGLRALYFALAGVITMFHYLKFGLSMILVFVGVKMILAHHFKIPIGIALGVVAAILVLSVIASLLWPVKETPPTHMER
ncbi:MAG: TerC family protein [Myxococcales bacterium]|nr:TerC family protein [Myxococcales bacterium]